MKQAFEIMNEEDPYLREIWAAGYDNVFTDNIRQEVILVKYDTKQEKRINAIDINSYFKIITGVLPDGKHHRWISEADGSAQRFRDLISIS